MRAFFERLAASSWGILEVFLTNASPIDLPRLAIQDHEDALQFLRAYGYQLGRSQDAAELDQIRREAVQFIQTVFLDKLPVEFEALEMPDLIRNAGPLELLMLASCPPDDRLQRWACAVLRVMHTLSHAGSELSMHFFPSIVRQILERYEQHIHTDADQTWLGGPGNLQLPLVDFHVKAGKDRESTLLKLLHKPENVAADLFDRIGVRFVTRDKLDVLLVLHYLRDQHLVAFPNVKPDRSNTLLDIAQIRNTFRDLQKRYDAAQISLEDFEASLRQSAALRPRQRALPFFKANPFSSQQYRSVQFTVRQLVRLETPNYDLFNHIRIQLAEMPQLVDTAHAAEEAEIKPFYRFFFPYEIQIVDAETHRNNMVGQASHQTYKLRQLAAARKRVLGPLLQKRRPRGS